MYGHSQSETRESESGGKAFLPRLASISHRVMFMGHCNNEMNEMFEFFINTPLHIKQISKWNKFFPIEAQMYLCRFANLFALDTSKNNTKKNKQKNIGL